MRHEDGDGREVQGLRANVPPVQAAVSASGKARRDLRLFIFVLFLAVSALFAPRGAQAFRATYYLDGENRRPDTLQSVEEAMESLVEDFNDNSNDAEQHYTIVVVSAPEELCAVGQSAKEQGTRNVSFVQNLTASSVVLANGGYNMTVRFVAENFTFAVGIGVPQREPPGLPFSAANQPRIKCEPEEHFFWFVNRAGFFSRFELELDGILVQNCGSQRGAGSQPPGEEGGAVYFSNALRPSEDLHVTVRYSNFQNNTAVNGAGLFVTGAASLTINGSVFSEGQATFGGAVFADSVASVFVSDTDFAKNVADDLGGALKLEVLKFAAEPGYRSDVYLLRCMFKENQAALAQGILSDSAGFGGGAIGTFTGPDSAQKLSLRLDYCLFIKNESPRGAALLLAPETNATLTNPIFTDNRCYTGANGACIRAALSFEYRSSVSIQGALFAGQSSGSVLRGAFVTAQGYQSFVDISDSSFKAEGGAICAPLLYSTDNAIIVLDGVTFTSASCPTTGQSNPLAIVYAHTAGVIRLAQVNFTNIAQVAPILAQDTGRVVISGLVRFANITLTETGANWPGTQMSTVGAVMCGDCGQVLFEGPGEVQDDTPGKWDGLAECDATGGCFWRCESTQFPTASLGNSSCWKAYASSEACLALVFGPATACGLAGNKPPEAGPTEISSSFTPADGFGWTVLGVGLFLLGCVGFVACFVIYRRRKSHDSREVESSNTSVEEELTPQLRAHASVVMAAESAKEAGARELHGIRIVKKLGEGNFGAVYKGDWAGTECALKHLLDDDALADGEIPQEIHLLASVDHPNVVRFLGITRLPKSQLEHMSSSEEDSDSDSSDSSSGQARPRGEQDGGEAPILFMVFEFVANGSVIDLLNTKRRKGERIAPDEKIRMLTDAARGCVYLAKRKIIHRDLACRNLLVSGSMQVMVSDLGLSRDLAGQGQNYYRSSGGAIAVKWASAEMLQQGKIGVKSDVCSFAFTAWELFMDGLAPFVSLTNDDAAKVILAGASSISEKLPRPEDCPEAVYDMMVRCWESDPADRPSFRAILKALSQLAPQSGLDNTDATGEAAPSASAVYAKTPSEQPYAKTPAEGGPPAGAYSKTPVGPLETSESQYSKTPSFDGSRSVASRDSSDEIDLEEETGPSEVETRSSNDDLKQQDIKRSAYSRPSPSSGKKRHSKKSAKSGRTKGEKHRRRRQHRKEEDE